MESSPKLFFDLHRPTDDKCYATVEEDYNKSQFEYTTYNYYNQKRDSLVDFASSHVNLRFGDGANGLPSPDTVDIDSALRNDKTWTPRGVQQLAVRTYHAVPDLSGGSVQDTKAEERLVLGEHTFDRSMALSGVHIEQQYYPLVETLRTEVQDSRHIVEPWIRGGDNTREASRSLAFLESQGYARSGTPSASTRAQPFVKHT